MAQTMVRYPIGKQDFKSLREEGYVYVDKTQYIIRLLEGSQIYFLSRPRRFGKSLFLSTLEYFFLGERQLFKGLAIDSYDWNWEEHPVIRIDLGAGDYTNPKTLDERLTDILARYEKKYGAETNPQSTFSSRIEQLIITAHNNTGKKVVVLVDEYEKPIIDSCDYPELMARQRETLRSIYSVFKILDAHLKLVFMTGITKFGQMSVFSGLNNIRDISLSEKYGAICGITETELISTFRIGIENLAEYRKIGFNDAVALLKQMYDGYHFSGICPDIYNPFSLVNALDECQLDSYWAATGTPSLLARVLLQKKFDLTDLEGIRVSKNRLTFVNEDFDDPIPLFYQTGYLTIKEYDKISEIYTLGYPNREVEQAFFSYILPFYYKKEVPVESLNDKLKYAVNNGNAESMMAALQALSAGISYDVIPKPEVERHFQYLLFVITYLLVSSNIRVSLEDKTSDGRIDLLIETPKYIYIIEIKRDKSPEIALNQIKDKDYALKYQGTNRSVFLIGVNFSTEKKRIEGYVIEPA